MSTTPEQHRALGLSLRKAGRLDDAVREFEAALRIAPDYAPAHYNIASIRLEQGRAEDAVRHWREAIRIKPGYHQAHAALAVALRRLGRLDEAIAAGQTAVRLDPDDINAHLSLGNALREAFRMDESRRHFERALQLDPRNVNALNNLGNLLTDLDQSTRGMELLRAAIAIDPNRAELHNNLGNILKSQASLDEAIECYGRTLSLQPDNAAVHSNLLLTLNCHPRGGGSLLREHLEWADRHAKRFYPNAPAANPRPIDRPLRIGYVSADFRRHSVAYFIEPLIEAHDRSQVEIHCYSDVTRADDVTARIRAKADRWHEIVGLSDERVARQIREDAIDILIDLAGHTANNRLLVFARKPAPVQASYIGYPNTTGLTTIDYRIVDDHTDPPGMTDSHCVERLVRVGGGFLCFRAPENAPPPSDPDKTGDVTFGTFNNFAKVTPAMIALWSRLLREVPGSRLLIKAETLGEDATRRAIRSRFQEHGVDPARLDLRGREKLLANHLQMYHEIDIALDTFPYNGTTTTCEAMWMGVPVVTLAGRVHAARVGASLLSGVGLSELIAESERQYITIAVSLARDDDRRRQIARGLRDRMRESPLMNATRMARALESAYRMMWNSRT